MARVRLPDHPGSRKNSKPKPRYGQVLPSPWPMPGYLLIEKPDGRRWWVREDLCREVIEE